MPSDEFGTSVGVSDVAAVVGVPLDDLHKGTTHVFSPVSQAANSALRVNPASYSVDEAAQKVILTVERTGATATAAAVNFSTESGTADGRKDYTQTLGTLSFAPGEVTKTLKVFVADDALQEPSRDLVVQTLERDGRDARLALLGTVTITSNDARHSAEPH